MKKIPIFYKQLIFILVTMLFIFSILIIAQNLILPSLYKNNIEVMMKNQIDQLNEAFNTSSEDDEEIYLDFINSIDGKISIYDKMGSPVFGDSKNLSLSLLIDLNDEQMIISENDINTVNSIQLIQLKDENIYIYTQSLEGLNQTLSLVNALSIYILIIGIICSFIASLLISKRLTKPIHQLIKFVDSEDVMLQNFNRKDEFNTLMLAFSNMKKHLRQNIEALKLELEREKKQDLLSKTFIANVSHEIRTPLSVIQSAMDMVLMSTDATKKETYTDMIYRQISLLERLSQDILMLSKLQSHVLKLHLESVNLFEFVDEVISEFHLIYETIDIKHLKPSHDVMLNFDKIRLKQVFTNLLNNAIKFKNNHAPIEIMYQINKPYVYVMLYNSSLPISEDHLPHLTNPFYKVNSEGFGLGLSIVKNIMASHQGNIFIKNHQKGVEITLRFNNE